VEGRRIVDARRRGKFILIELEGDHTLLVHLRMTGGFVYAADGCDLPSATRAVFQLSDGRRLGYQDTRNLGVVKLVPSARIETLKELRTLGMEPLGEHFDAGAFRAMLNGRRRSIKEFLLDQTKVVGVGNIYAAETLFRARLDPRRSAASVAASDARTKTLHESITNTLSETTRCQQSGPPIHFDFVGLDYPGESQVRSDILFQVYDREGEPCFHCRRRIKRIKQGGRSTYFCPGCQR
jgi:formamidopyrimidine-DNA glycosylase